jgi:hypothetical protein
MLICLAYSTVDLNITWFRYSNKSSDYVPVGPRAEILSNGTMIIRYVDFKRGLVYGPLNEPRIMHM